MKIKQSFLINIDFIRLLKWSGVERLLKKEYEGSKIFVGLYIYIFFETRITMW